MPMWEGYELGVASDEEDPLSPSKPETPSNTSSQAGPSQYQHNPVKSLPRYVQRLANILCTKVGTLYLLLSKVLPTMSQ